MLRSGRLKTEGWTRNCYSWRSSSKFFRVVRKSKQPTKLSSDLIKHCYETYVFVKFETKRSTRTLQVGIKYSMRNVICDVISYGIW